MIAHSLISVDIGSTWTKAARFKLHNDRFELVKRSSVPTSVDFLPDSFFAVLNEISPEVDWRRVDQAPAPLFFSSSAKGGLKVAVVGLVPEMSLQIGRLAAFSAGARICATFPYRLTRKHIAEIEQMKPDILLLCGGTDGGNERYVCENAVSIANSDFQGAIVYAGNNLVAERIAETLAGKDCRLAENLMPEFGRLNIESARAVIREVFLDRIVIGKGLESLINQFGVQPLPTPLAVFNLVEAIGKNCAGWQNFALIDMGGATTDFYSFTDAFHPESGTVIKGIIEPRLKRTVEGDLGLRVSANAVLGENSQNLQQRLARFDHGVSVCFKELIDYIEEIGLRPDFLPSKDKEKEIIFDRILAEICVEKAMLRHAGTIEEVYTTAGPVWAQHGKDLRHIDRIVGSGGYLAAMGRECQKLSFFSSDSRKTENKIALMPEKFSYFSDIDYLWPLLGNLATRYPAQAAISAVEFLSRQTEMGVFSSDSAKIDVKISRTAGLPKLTKIQGA